MQLSERTSQELKREMALEILRAGGTLRLKTFGTSMVPSLWPGDTVLIKTKPVDDLRYGDIVLIAREDRLVVHRVVEIGQTEGIAYLVTRGDSLAAADAPANEPNVLGCVAAVERNGRLLIPRRRRSPLNRLFGALLGRSRGLLNWTLRVRRRVVQPQRPEQIVFDAAT